jgi:hypothetical protein
MLLYRVDQNQPIQQLLLYFKSISVLHIINGW